MEESTLPSRRALAGLKSHKLNALNGMLTLSGRPRNGHDGAAPPETAKRLDVIKAYAADALPAEDTRAGDPSAGDATASQIAQRFAPRPGSFPPPDEDRISAGPLAPPLLALASGARTLAAALVAVALLPNLVLAGLIWYGGIEPRWPSVTEEPLPAEPSQTLAVHSVMTTPIPAPPLAREDAAADAATSADEVTSALPAGESAGVPEVEQGEDLAAAKIDAAPQAGASTEAPESVPLPTRRPAPPSADDAPASWVKPTAYVNLRTAPASRASVVAVIAKGTKLRVVARKRGWVQATDPATEKTGWVYSGNVVAAR